MNRRTFLGGAAAVLAQRAVPAVAQGRTPRIAYVSPHSSNGYRRVPFLEGLAELGYVVGENIEIEYFLALANDGLPAAARRAVDSAPDVIVAITRPAALLVKDLTATIPTVFAGIGDPVSTGLVASLSYPGGNLTGPSIMTTDLSGKRLQFLADMVPDLSRVGRLYWFGAETSGAEVILAGRALGVEIVSRKLEGPADLGPALDAVVAEGAQAIYLRAGPILSNNVAAFVAETNRRRLPSISDNRLFPDSGGLMAYGANLPDTFRRAAYYVDRILQGNRPEELPVEQPRLIDLVINRTAAAAMNIDIPPKLLIQATEVIE